MLFDFHGKRYIVTGAGRGIGRALVRAIVDAGGEVYALSLTKERLESVAKESKSIHPIQVDLSDWEATRKAIEGIDVVHGVINNAAYIDEYVDSLEMPKDRLNQSFSVNVLAPINIIQTAAKKMIASGIHGSIVNVSSIAGINPPKTFMDYSVSKASLDMVTKQFALELGAHQIRVNSVNPTWVWVESIEKDMEKYPDRANKARSLIPLGRFCDVQEAVDPIMYLLSEHSSMVTGTTHVVDGGLLSHIPV